MNYTSANRIMLGSEYSSLLKSQQRQRLFPITSKKYRSFCKRNSNCSFSSFSNDYQRFRVTTLSNNNIFSMSYSSLWDKNVVISSHHPKEIHHVVHSNRQESYLDSPIRNIRKRFYHHQNQQLNQHFPFQTLMTHRSLHFNKKSKYRITYSTYNHHEQNMDKRILFQYLDLESYDKNEFNASFDRIHLHSNMRKIVDHHTTNINNYNNVVDDATNTKLYITQEDLSNFIFTRITEMDEQYSKNEHTLSEERKRIFNDERISYANHEAKAAWSLLVQNGIDNNVHVSTTDSDTYYNYPRILSKEAYCENITNLATEIDMSKSIPLSISMMLVGSSVGVVIPLMPAIVHNLGLSAGEYGIVVGSFAVAKLFANVPAAILVERHGRKPYLVYSLVVISLGVGCIGLSSQFEHLVLCRLLTGFGVSALTTATTLTIADSSTPLNRASTMAPMMSGFAAGTALGPAIGGMLADKIGANHTFYLVGGTYLALTAINNLLLNETKLPSAQDRIFPWHEKLKVDNNINTNQNNEGKNIEDGDVLTSIKDAVSQWSPLMSDPRVRNVVLMNGFYWMALSGAQMTLLPLILTNADGLAFSATQVGKMYMGMSLVQVLGNPSMAKFVDKMGKLPSIITGCTILSSAMIALPFCSDINEVALALGVWSLGSCILSTSPVSYVSDVVGDGKRAQAIALLRTAGDVGFLVGAAGTGIIADCFDMDTAVHVSAGLLLSATGWFTSRQFLDSSTKK